MKERAKPPVQVQTMSIIFNTSQYWLVVDILLFDSVKFRLLAPTSISCMPVCSFHDSDKERVIFVLRNELVGSKSGNEEQIQKITYLSKASPDD